MNGIGKRLYILRKERDMTLDELGNKLGLPKSSLSRYEKGKSEPSIETVKKIAKYFNVSIDWLIGDTDIREVNRLDIEYYDTVREILIECKDNNIPIEKVKHVIELLKEV